MGWHVLQAEPHFCVPACVCIVAKAQGKTLHQAELAARWPGSSRGFALKDAAEAISGEHLTVDPSNPVTLDALLQYLGDGTLIVAQVFSSTMHEVASRFSPRPTSPHGPLCTGHFGRLHAIVPHRS